MERTRRASSVRFSSLVNCMIPGVSNFCRIHWHCSRSLMNMNSTPMCWQYAICPVRRGRPLKHPREPRHVLASLQVSTCGILLTRAARCSVIPPFGLSARQRAVLHHQHCPKQAAAARPSTCSLGLPSPPSLVLPRDAAWNNPTSGAVGAPVQIRPVCLPQGTQPQTPGSFSACLCESGDSPGEGQADRLGRAPHPGTRSLFRPHSLWQSENLKKQPPKIKEPALLAAYLRCLHSSASPRSTCLGRDCSLLPELQAAAPAQSSPEGKGAVAGAPNTVCCDTLEQQKTNPAAPDGLQSAGSIELSGARSACSSPSALPQCRMKPGATTDGRATMGLLL